MLHSHPCYQTVRSYPYVQGRDLPRAEGFIPQLILAVGPGLFDIGFCDNAAPKLF